MSGRHLGHEIAFDGMVVEWRGPAPFYFVSVPEDVADALRIEAKRVSYGWGCVPAMATIGGIEFTTSLIPRNGTYLLPLKIAVRETVRAAPGEHVHAVLRLAPPRGRHDPF